MLFRSRSRPELTDPRFDRVRISFDEDGRWLVVHRGTLRIVANLGADEAAVPLAECGVSGPGGAVTLLASSEGIAVAADALLVPPATFGVVESVVR